MFDFIVSFNIQSCLYYFLFLYIYLYICIPVFYLHYLFMSTFSFVVLLVCYVLGYILFSYFHLCVSPLNVVGALLEGV